MSNELSNVQQRSIGAEQVVSRQVAEVQAMMAIAKRYPRNVHEAITRIDTACSRPSLAECAMYEYAKGGTKITGPSIRLAEVLAQNWGNIDFGLNELDRTFDEDGIGLSTVQAYAWDVETNVRRSISFTVRHWRDTKQGGYQLKDERDIYELMANQGARRMRACILNVIPGDIQDLAIAKCEKTLAGESTEPMADRVRKMILAFKEFDVTVDMLARKVGHSLDSLSLTQLATLKKVYQSLRDGVGTREDLFDVKGSEEESSSTPTKAQETAKKVADKQATKKPKEEPKVEPKPEPKQEQQPQTSEAGDEPSSFAGGDEPTSDEFTSPAWKKFYDMYQACTKAAQYAKLKGFILQDKRPIELNPQEMSKAVKMCEQGYSLALEQEQG